MPPPTARQQAALLGAHWLLLGTWLGSWTLFAAVVAPTAFRVLPSTEVAGLLVGPVLTSLHLYGAVAGVALALLTVALRRGPVLAGLPLLMTAACLYSHFGVSAELAEIRDLAFGAGGSTAAAARFNQLHERSVALFGAVGLAALLLVVLHLRADVLRATA